ncbi:sensor histidine kinase [Qaidamihabitans albus]|uniref:sensor histidine kinase n=1 Tax=Qaidamihabitans albus TaxID=2795733 RepID=UPI0018F1BD49|nr:histidine kinase [Qaidamihabitans albus]
MTSSARQPNILTTQRGSRALLDAVIAAAALASTLIQLGAHGDITMTPPGSRALDMAGLLLAALATTPLILWRRYPLGVFVATTSACAALAGLDYPIDLIIGPTVAIYLLAANRAPDTKWQTSTTATIVGLLAAYLTAAAVANGTFPGLALLHTALAAGGAWFAGERTRLRREQMATVTERALRAEQSAEQERQLAVAEERARIARDLHDSAGHAISLIAVRAGAARLRHPQEPDRSPAAFADIEELARQTVTDIDEFVGTLREGESPNGAVNPPAGLASLDTLITHHATTTGLTITVDTTGQPRRLGGVVDQATYRIISEALTNAARHGTGTAKLALTFGDDVLDLTVTNPIRTASQSRPGGGHGLIGMRERATLLGGHFDTANGHGTFRIHARIPYRGHRR